MYSIRRDVTVGVMLLLAACAVLIGMPAGAATGDADGDGRVTLGDAVLVLRTAVRAISLSDEARAAVDMDGDGVITVKDALVVLKMVVGLLPKLSDSTGTTGPTDTVPPAPPIAERLAAMVVDTDKFGYKPGEQITVKFTLRNLGTGTCTWTFPSSQVYEVRILNFDEKEVWRWSYDKMFLTVVTTLTLGPGESRSWTEVWDQKDNSGAQVPDGYYRAVVELAPTLDRGSAQPVSASATFGIGLDYQEPPSNPLPLIVGEERRFVCVDRGWPERWIKTVGQKVVDGVPYMVVSQTPDGAQDVLLRMADIGQVMQRVDNRESVRYRLHAAVGETWTFNAGTPIKVTMASRSDVLETPLGKYEGCLRFEFFGGPDLAWTEWLAPGVGWVGWNFYGIAGPVSYRIVSYSLPFVPPTPVPPVLPAVRVEVDPPYAVLAPGAQVQFKAKVADSFGNILDVPVKWSCDEQLGRIGPDGKLHASQTPGAAGAVTATVVIDGKEYMGYAKVAIQAAVPGPGPEYEYGRAYVQGGSVEAFPAGPGSVTFVLKFFAPSSSWEFDRVDTAVRDNLVVLTPVIRTSAVPHVDLPVLKPLDAKLTLERLAPGGYDVVLVGRDGELKIKVMVSG
ncbi:MAG: BsuPI-related putative proteinase inhibitor [Armatimonadota bacterium]